MSNGRLPSANAPFCKSVLTKRKCENRHFALADPGGVGWVQGESSAAHIAKRCISAPLSHFALVSFR
ncbi:hypothetical protein UY416_25715, partial [Paenibacillus polymyxa]|uniref:hypothetical protein n=1 Tax=Paenibacillus polymyxa TaxID=1406 RepID=UPI002AB5CA73